MNQNQKNQTWADLRWEVWITKKQIKFAFQKMAQQSHFLVFEKRKLILRLTEFVVVLYFQQVDALIHRGRDKPKGTSLCHQTKPQQEGWGVSSPRLSGPNAGGDCL